MRCGIYIRVSTDKEEQKASLRYQKELFFNYVAEKGWDIFEFYVDVQSGTTANRENFQRMINDAQQGKFDVILAKELSRVARNGELSYKIKNLCENKGIHIITLDNAINTLNGNTHMFGLFAWMYEQESQNTSNRVKETLNTRARKGLYKGSVPPYGYEIADGKLKLRKDNTPEIVRRIFKEYLNGYGRGTIAKRLYEEGIPTPSDIVGKKNAGDKWHDSTIKIILTNPHYTGDLVQRRTTTISVTNKKRKNVSQQEQIIIRDAHEPIISRDVFLAVQEQLKIRSRKIPAPKKHLFTNILYCAECGSRMWYRQNGKTYICGNYARHGTKACSGQTIKEKLLNEIIRSDINSLIEKIDHEYYLNQLEAKAQKSNANIKNQIEKANKYLEVLKGRKRKYINMLADNQITQVEYLDMVEANNQETAKALADLENITKCNEHKITADLPKLKKELLIFLSFKELTPEVIDRLIERVEVKKDGTVKIKYLFSTPVA